MSVAPFHLAFPVTDLTSTVEFYGKVLGCSIGRESERWVDFDFFGHQITAHLVDNMPTVSTNLVDGKQVPSSHFGMVLEWQQWQEFSEKLKIQKIEFLIEPYLRFRDEPGEQATMFILDPSGNGLEFKAFKNPDDLFAT